MMGGNEEYLEEKREMHGILVGDQESRPLGEINMVEIGKLIRAVQHLKIV